MNNQKIETTRHNLKQHKARGGVLKCKYFATCGSSENCSRCEENPDNYKKG